MPASVEIQVQGGVVTSHAGRTEVTRIEIPNSEAAEQIASHYLRHEIARARGRGPLLVVSVGVVTEVSPARLVEIRAADPDLAAACARYAEEVDPKEADAEGGQDGEDRGGAVIVPFEDWKRRRES